MISNSIRNIFRNLRKELTFYASYKVNFRTKFFFWFTLVPLEHITQENRTIFKQITKNNTFNLENFISILDEFNTLLFEKYVGIKVV